MMTAAQQGLEAALGVTEPRPLARGKLVDLMLIVGAAALALVTVTIVRITRSLTGEELFNRIGRGTERRSPRANSRRAPRRRRAG
jgi:uncharacterized BrkB/YihY/UPF0761 family membrane protein